MAPPTIGLLLAPGAGASRDHSALVAMDAAVIAAGVAVRRMDFPYRLAGRRAPDRAPVLVAAVVTEAAGFAAETGLPLQHVYVGGRSMGGRMCSMAVADGLAAAGLVLVSYPLHPPGRSEQLRTEHFGRLDVPCLFVSGTRDAFAARDELELAVEAIPGPVTTHWLEGGDHGLRRRDRDVAEIVAGWLAAQALGVGRA
jgi:hypothetical protein